MTAPDSPTRSLTIDRARRARIVRDLVHDVARARPGSWWVGATVVVLIALAVAGNVWWAGLGLLIAAASIQLVVWWAAAARGTRHGLGVDDTVSVGYAPDGLLVLTGRRGEFRMARGSAQLVRRSGRNATVFGRSVSLVLPGELLSEQDVAFLEGHGEPAARASQEVSGLPLRLQVTERIQGDIVSAATRWVLTTADFRLPYVAAGCVAALTAVTRVWDLLWISGVFVVLALPMLGRLVKMRKAFREQYPVGRMLEARVAPEALTLALRHGMAVTPWHQYEAVKATDSVVLLRHRRRRFGSGSVEVLPLELFGPEEIRTIAAAVPRRF